MLGPFLDDGRTPDRNSQVQTAPIPAGALRIADPVSGHGASLGYCRLDTFREPAEQGGRCLSRYKVGAKLYRPDGAEPDLGKLLTDPAATDLDQPVLLGQRRRRPVRLLATGAPPEARAQRRRQLKDQARKKRRPISKARLAWCDWNVHITNAPPALLSRDEALVLAMRPWYWLGYAGGLNCSANGASLRRHAGHCHDRGHRHDHRHRTAWLMPAGRVWNRTALPASQRLSTAARFGR